MLTANRFIVIKPVLVSVVLTANPDATRDSNGKMPTK